MRWLFQSKKCIYKKKIEEIEKEETTDEKHFRVSPGHYILLVNFSYSNDKEQKIFAGNDFENLLIEGKKCKIALRGAVNRDLV